MIIFRYLAKEIIYVTLAITGILVFILLCNELIHYLGYIAAGKFASWVLLHLLMLQVPSLIGLLLPFGLFLGILLSYGRLYADSEMTVLFACGMTGKQLLRLTLIIAAIFSVLVGILVFWINPIIAKQFDLVMMEAKSTALLQTIMPGQFRTFLNNRDVYYVEKVSRDRKQMQNIFLAQKPVNKPIKAEQSNKFLNGNQWITLVGSTASQNSTDKAGIQTIIINNGYRYQGMPGQEDFSIVKFDSLQIRIAAPNFFVSNKTETVPTFLLWKQREHDPNYQAEWQWRLSVPISTLLLAILAVQLSQVKPRQGRFAKILPAVLIYVIYANLLFMGRDWIENSIIPSWLGLWWTHALLLVVIAIVYLYQNRIFLLSKWFYRQAGAYSS